MSIHRWQHHALKLAEIAERVYRCIKSISYVLFDLSKRFLNINNRQIL